MLRVDAAQSWGHHSDFRKNRLGTLNNKMPVDFASYLLQASPPGLGFYGYNDDLHSKRFSVKCHVAIQPKPIIIMKPKLKVIDSEPNSPENSPTSSPVSSDDEDHDDVDVDDDNDTEVEEEEGASGFIFSSDDVNSDSSKPEKKKKTVTFADTKGLALTEVKLIKESTDMPPRLPPQLLLSLTQGASPCVTQASPLCLDFAQPASDYMNFRRILDEQNVSLENVILKDYNVMGTIKVKNISFDKNVFVRCSFDSWKSHTDISARYVPCGRDHTSSSGHLMYDTFSFEITVPSLLSREQDVEFCICFECDSGQFWDSAGGRNYRIVCAHLKEDPTKLSDKPYTKDFKPNFDYVESWSEYSSWSHVDRETPYY